MTDTTDIIVNTIKSTTPHSVYDQHFMGGRGGGGWGGG